MLNDEQIAEAQRTALEVNLKDPGFLRGYERMNSLIQRAEGHDAAVRRAEQAEADLAEMTRLRDNAIRAAVHADQSIDVDLEGLIADGVADLNIEWDEGLSDEWFIGKFADLVHPVVAHAVKRAETAEAAGERVLALAADMRTWCSPRNFAIRCADAIDEVLAQPKDDGGETP